VIRFWRPNKGELHDEDASLRRELIQAIACGARTPNGSDRFCAGFEIALHTYHEDSAMLHPPMTRTVSGSRFAPKLRIASDSTRKIVKEEAASGLAEIDMTTGQQP
jgi:hypothetical protein